MIPNTGAQFKNRAECDRFLEENGITVDRLSRDAMWSESVAWQPYRRPGGKTDRILTDFLIGGHAHCQAARLISRDRGTYDRTSED